MLARSRITFLLVALFVALVAAACEKVPLLAPSGSTISLVATTNALPSNGSMTIVAQVLESAGMPPHSGTLVTFTSTLGRVEPGQVETDASGRATVTFLAGSASGTATISAASGGASTGANGALKIAVGAAAVGRVTLTATPNPIPAGGGTTTVVAQVLDVNGNALPGVAVNFAASSGTLTQSVATTDTSGTASSALTTASQSTVTATVGAAGGTSSGSTGSSTPVTSSAQSTASVTVNVNAQPTASITAPSGTLTAGAPLTFLFSVGIASGSTAQIRNVSMDFGDGSKVDLGAVTGNGLSAAHRYEDEGSYTVRLTVTDSLGGVTQAASAILVQPEPPLSVFTTGTSVSVGVNTIYTITAIITPSNTTVTSYYWTFDGSSPQVTTNPQVIKSFSTASGSHIVSVTITTSTGRTATGQIVITP